MGLNPILIYACNQFKFKVANLIAILMLLYLATLVTFIDGMMTIIIFVVGLRFRVSDGSALFKRSGMILICSF